MPVFTRTPPFDTDYADRTLWGGGVGTATATKATGNVYVNGFAGPGPTAEAAHVFADVGIREIGPPATQGLMVVEATVQYSFNWGIISRLNYASATARLKLVVEAVGSGAAVETPRILFDERGGWWTNDFGSGQATTVLTVSTIVDPSKTYVADVSASGDVYAGPRKSMSHRLYYAHADFQLEANVLQFRIVAP
jgi:hypothetical protein